MRVSLAKALKLKNRLVRRLTSLNDDVRQYNRFRIATGPDLDVRAALEARLATVDRLVTVKAAIGDANAPVRADIYRLGELKSLASLLKGLAAPVAYNPYATSDEADRWGCTLGKGDIDTRLAEVEQEIDLLQDKLDAFNAATTIDLPWEEE